jgi:hypothetical protein
MAQVQTHNSVPRELPRDAWTLCFQQVTYRYDDGAVEDGYRFIWRRPNGSLQPARGQARIPNAEALHQLLRSAEREGWFTAE